MLYKVIQECKQYAEYFVEADTEEEAKELALDGREPDEEDEDETIYVEPQEDSNE